MKSLSKFLIALGLSYRATVFLFIFIVLFSAAGIVGGFATGNYTIISSFLPLVVVTGLLGIVLFNKHLSEELKNHEREKKKQGHHAQNKSGRVMYISMACHGTYVGVGFLFVLGILFLGLEDYIIELLIGYVFVGWIVIYKLFWPYYSRNLR